MSDGVFSTLGIPLKRGRDFTRQDTAQAPLVVVNEAFARRFFPGEDVVGKRVIIGYDEPKPREIVGVVGDVRARALDKAAEPELYAPVAQTPWPSAAFVVGLVLALAMSWLLEGLLYDVSATDPLTFVSVPVLLLTVVALASWLPARRASKVPPGVAMSVDDLG